MKEAVNGNGALPPIIDECDVLVLGGGVAGCAAALAASRNGAKVCVVEKSYSLGGLATTGLICYFLPLCDGCGHQVIGGIAEEFFHAAIKMGPGKIPECWRRDASVEERDGHNLTAEFNPFWFMLELEKKLVDAGVNIIYDSRLCSAVVKDGRITDVIVENKSGRRSISCKCAIDATGDADLCSLCNEDTVSLDSNRRAAWFYSVDESGMHMHIMGDKFFEPVPDGSPTFSGDDWESVTKFMIDSRNIIRDAFEDLRAKQSNVTLGAIPGVPLMRKTRRLKGLYEISEADEDRYCPTAIGVTGYYRKKGLHLYFPYECLIGKTRNLFAAGRCISSKEEFAWNITRGIPSSSVTGQASGTAAAICAKENIDAQSIDPVALREKLISQGARIDLSYATHK